MREPLSRRAALAAGLTGATALALGPAAAAARGPDESSALTALARAEDASRFVYLNGGPPAAGPLAGQELEHAKALAVHLEALGLPAPAPVRDPDRLPAAARAVLAADGDGARLRAAIAWEQELIDGCAEHLGALEEPNTIRTVATIMASHAQHRQMLRLSSAP